jgi:RNAse (barnase) inhibitor barstar
MLGVSIMENEETMSDEEFDNLYEDILNNGLINEEYKQKLIKLMDAYGKNVDALSDYAEIDVTQWGNPIY